MSGQGGTEAVCSSTCCGGVPGFGVAALNRLMPMHLTVAANGRILRVGPTLQKLRLGSRLEGMQLFDLFELRRPKGLCHVRDLIETDSGQVSLAFRNGVRGNFKGVAAALPCGHGVLINLSFGISVVDAVQAYDLTLGDFAGTDLAVEMLYLVEAKSAALQESKKLNLRLQGAKVAAEEQAFTDTLTGLKNLRAMDHVLGRLIADGTPFGVMHVDLDFFKEVNDTYGHAAGDLVLQNVARVLVSETRAVDTVARVGGDEFVLIIRDQIDLQKLGNIAMRIIARLEEPVPYNGVYCRISGSIGLTTSIARGRSGQARILKDADLALYASKDAGRGRYTVFTPDLERARRSPDI
ncbi:GGDEF domain-containing protein [Tropicimonas sp. IMCC34043]|uniref:GGDEF domain-containing protein n=1 Tax=Tropicimonas sp. IMCC34043 TaxID=2248760 RepID=UPI000E24F13A|nr:GGDEF domain-containing protein [Tropicimonas sp. IMCC34043]